MLLPIAGVCFLVSALCYFYLHGFHLSGYASSSDGHIMAGLQLLTGCLFLIRSLTGMRACR